MFKSFKYVRGPLFSNNKNENYSTMLDLVLLRRKLFHAIEFYNDDPHMVALIVRKLIPRIWFKYLIL